MKKSRKRIVRYGLLTANFAVLLAVATFVLNSSHSDGSVRHSSSVAAKKDETIANPLDQISSADIAANVAQMTKLTERTSVANHADSFNVQATISDDNNTVVTKPQVIVATAKSRSDIVAYTTQPGDTVSSIAAKYNVTSDSIKNTNDLSSDTVAANVKITVPPVNGIVYTVQAGDTVDSLAQKYSAKKEAIVDINDAEVRGIKVGEQIIIPDAVKPVAPRPVVVSTPSYGGFAFGATALYGDGGYDFGWCTFWAALRRAQIGRPVPKNLGNAYSWLIIAQRAGLPTGNTPEVGAVAVFQGGNHVSVVEQVNDDGSFWVSEMNASGQVSIDNPTPTGGWNRVDYHFYASPGPLRFIY